MLRDPFINRNKIKIQFARIINLPFSTLCAYEIFDYTTLRSIIENYYFWEQNSKSKRKSPKSESKMANYDYFSAPKNMQPRILKRLVIGQKENSSSWKDKPFPFSSDSSLQGLIIFIWVMLIFGPVARTSCGRVCPGWNFWIFFNRFSVLLQFSWGLEIYDFFIK
jgi:hypothetical protein